MTRPHLKRDYQRKHPTAVSKTLRRRAVHSRCPSCGRKAALKREEWVGFVLITCRWCPYEDGYDIGMHLY